MDTVYGLYKLLFIELQPTDYLSVQPTKLAQQNILYVTKHIVCTIYLSIFVPLII